ncbi:recombinase family protein [Clostridioides difficile]|nr:recombinase family protein [Clostridioides difficile]MDN9160249.1 recombinase family protein [Clostridioides difficile]
MLTNNKEIKNIFMYCRTSTDLQIDNFSIPFQINKITDYCKLYDYNISGKYIDEGKSGTTIKNRTNFIQMIEDMKSKSSPIQAILVYNISRLSRNLSDIASIIKLLEEYNITLISIDDNINTSDIYGRSIAYMLGTFAELSRYNIVNTCRSGMEQRAKEGLWNGGKIFGYVSNVDKELEIVPEQAKTIKEIFNLYVNKNWGYKKITCHLNAYSYKTLNNGTWSIQSIKQIIDNPIYAGFIRWGQYIDWAKKRRKGKNKNYELFQGKHQPIIDMDTWEKSQAMRKVNKDKFNKIYEGDFILTGLLRCPVCGASMISHRTKKKNKPNEFYRYYQCSNFFNKGVTVCNSNLVNADIAEKYVLNRISEIINSKEIITSLIAKLNSTTINDITPIQNKQKELKKSLAKIEMKRNEYMEKHFNDSISFDDYNASLKYLREKEADFTTQLNIAESEISRLSTSQHIDAEKVINILQNFNDIFINATVEQKKSLLCSIIDSISVCEGKAPKDRTINKIKLHFEPVDIQAQKINKRFATTCDTVLHYLSYKPYKSVLTISISSSDEEKSS